MRPYSEFLVPTVSEFLVPTVSVGTFPSTLRVACVVKSEHDAERPDRGSHSERGNQVNQVKPATGFLPLLPEGEGGRGDEGEISAIKFPLLGNSPPSLCV